MIGKSVQPTPGLPFQRKPSSRRARHTLQSLEIGTRRYSFHGLLLGYWGRLKGQTLAGAGGFEPPNAGSKDLCLTT